MAGAEAAVQRVEIVQLNIPQKLIDGSKFIKCNENDAISAVPVTLRLHEKGYLLYWQEPNKDVECLELSSIRDTRTGKYAKVPRQDKVDRWKATSSDAEIRSLVSTNECPLEKKCLTIVYGVKFPEPCFLNFIAVGENPDSTVEEWADFLLKLAYHPLTRHVSVETCIEKIYARLSIETTQFGQIQVKKLIKMFGGHTKRVEEVLKGMRLINDKNRHVIEADDFPLIAFKKVMQLTCQRPELDEVFKGFGTRRMAFHSLSKEQLKEFLNNTQRDPRLNEILYPFHSEEQIESIIGKYEPNIMLSKRAQLSLEGLDAFLQSDENLPISPQRYCLYQDMTQPFSHYFINSSHNTYLTGSQYKSKSDAEMYRQVLLAGCRCVELDCWEGQDEPYINHGFTFCSPVDFKEVIEAINESAFKTSKYPVILSFENHVDNPHLQAKMAQYCRDIFGEKLLIDPLSEYPLEPHAPLPSPEELVYKIIIKNKKARVHADAPMSKSSNTSDEKGHKHKRGSLVPDNSASAAAGMLAAGAAAKMLNNQKNNGSNGTPTKYRKKSEPAILPSKSNPAFNSSNSESDKGKKRRNIEKSESSPAITTKNIDMSSRHSSPDIFNNVNLNDKPSARAAAKRSGHITPLSEDPEQEESETEPINKPETIVEENNNIDKGKLSKIVAEENQTEEKISEDKISDKKEKETKEDKVDGESQNEDGEKAEDSERKSSVKGKGDEDEDSDDEGILSLTEYEQNSADSGTAMRESKAYEAMSSLVNYVQPVRFKSFEISERRYRCYEMSSFTETNAFKLVMDNSLDIVKYNKRQTCRIYPKGARIESTNYNPQIFWNAGCQFVALNFQTLDHPMQLNLGMFEFNGNSGFVLKPPQLRMKDKEFDPMTELNVDGIVAGYVSIKIISGQFLATSKVNTFVEVDMYGLYVDMVRKKHKTKTVMNNGLNPYYNEKPFEFKKVVMPSLAMLRIAVIDSSNNRLLGHRFVPVDGLRPGYRYITLRNEGNQPLTMPSIFVYIQVKDFVPDSLITIAAALANPQEYIQEKDKEDKERKEKEKALKLLLDDGELDEVGIDTKTNKDINGEPRGKEPVVVICKVENGTELPDRKENETRIIVGPDNNNVKTNGEKTAPVKGSSLPLESFQPKDLKAIQQLPRAQQENKAYNQIMRDFQKKQDDDFEAWFKICFMATRKPSLSSKFKKMIFNKNTVSVPPVSLNPTLPDDAKRQQLIQCLKMQFFAEKKFKITELEKKMQQLEITVKDHQAQELVELKKTCSVEEGKVMEKHKKNMMTRLAKLSPNLSKSDLDRKKSEINDMYKKECIKDRRILEGRQEKRLENVIEAQKVIYDSIHIEGKKLETEITDDIEKKNGAVEQIYKMKATEIHSRKGKSIVSINGETPTSSSVTSPPNDDSPSGIYELAAPENYGFGRRVSGGQFTFDGF